MARTHGRIKVEVWESGSDYRQLSVDAQWAYQMLVSQPSITMCGTLLYAPKKWAKLAAGLTLERVERAVAELEAAWYVIVDRESDELLVRSFVKHDKPWGLVNLIKAAQRQFREIESEEIRDYLARRHEWLLDLSTPVQQLKEQVESYEHERASERSSERTLPLSFERASESPSERSSESRAGTRAPTAPSPTTGPSPDALGNSAVSVARAREPGQEELLPFEKELAVTKLLERIGPDADEETPEVVRYFAGQVPLAAIEKVSESLAEGSPRDRAAYVVGGLKREFAEREQAL